MRNIFILLCIPYLGWIGTVWTLKTLIALTSFNHAINGKRGRFNSQMKLTRESSSANQKIRLLFLLRSIQQSLFSDFLFLFLQFIFFYFAIHSYGSRLSRLMDKSEIVRCLKSSQYSDCLLLKILHNSNQKKVFFSSSSSVFM